MRTWGVGVFLFSFLVLTAGVCFAQAPTGSIAGTITDVSGAVIPNASISVTNKETGLARAVSSSASGNYTVASLAAGNYEVKVEASGFQSRERMATVETGHTTNVDFQMEVGATREIVAVSDVAPQIEYDSHKVDGLVSRRQIRDLPLNGRNFLELAFLEPGVTVSTASPSQYNHLFNIQVLGGNDVQTRITVDGANTVDFVDGGSQQNFSQEIIQEFQVSTLNFDLSTGFTDTGAINIVTRSGGNQFHGAGYFYFRDHNMSAYSGLKRPAPTDPLFREKSDPFFARRQSGFYLGGPIVKDRVFFFTNLEHINQLQVVEAQPRAPEFAQFGGLFPSPYVGTVISNKFDFRIGDKHSGFLRYSHDGNHAMGPRTQNSLPSNWVKNTNWADQSVGSLTSALRPTLVNEARFAYTYWNNRNRFPTSADCPNCIGLGLPQIEIGGMGGNSVFTIGNTTNAPQGRDLRHFITDDNVTWQHGSHRLRWGGEWDYGVGTGFWAFLDPALMVLYSPAQVRTFNQVAPLLGLSTILVPPAFNSIQDILNLPLAGFNTAIGDPSQPPLFQMDRAKKNNRFHLYWQDTWKIHPRFTLNYGLAWNYESNVLNHDLDKPAILGPVLGANNLGPEEHSPRHFSPSFGFAWAVTKDNKTVIRAGGGIYYGTLDLFRRLVERTTVGPLGNGRLALPGSAVPNPFGAVPGLPAIPGVAPGTPLSFTSVPTNFRGAHLVGILSAVQAGLVQQLGLLGGKLGNTDLSIRTIDLFKTTPFPDSLLTRDFTTPYSEHVNVGIQRRLMSDLVVSADFVYRQSIHTLLDNADYNHWVDPPPAQLQQLGFKARDPVLPRCSAALALFPKAPCSNGVILVDASGAREHYRGLLVKVDKRFSHRYQLLGSYAYSSNVGFNAVTNQDNWFDSWGPGGSQHILNVSGIVELPWDPTNLLCPKKRCSPFQVSFISQFASQPPFNATIAGVDFNGDGTDGDRLPGSKYNEFGRGLGKSDLVNLVSQFNQALAGKRTSRGQAIPAITLPSSFEFNGRFVSQDLRLSKTFNLSERYKITILGEVFNLFNVANLGGFGTNLVETSSFGQPTNRGTSSFGSGIPRAFQVAARFTF